MAGGFRFFLVDERSAVRRAAAVTGKMEVDGALHARPRARAAQRRSAESQPRFRPSAPRRRLSDPRRAGSPQFRPVQQIVGVQNCAPFARITIKSRTVRLRTENSFTNLV